MINSQRRNATVCCQTDVSMLAIEGEDFVKIFMANDTATEPDFITFLRQIPEVRSIRSIEIDFFRKSFHLVSWISNRLNST